MFVPAVYRHSREGVLAASHPEMQLDGKKLLFLRVRTLPFHSLPVISSMPPCPSDISSSQ